MDNVALGLLSEMGVRGTTFPKVNEYPTMLKANFVGLFDEYLKTRYAKDLYDFSKGGAVGRLNVYFGFISYTMNYTGTLFSRPFNLNKQSAYYISAKLKAERQRHKQFMEHRQFLKEFMIADARVELPHRQFNRDINVLYGFDATVTYVLTVKKKKKLLHNLEDHSYEYAENTAVLAMQRIKQYAFSREIPTQLLPKSNFRETYPRVGHVLKLPARLYAEIDKGVYAHLGSKTSIVLRFPVSSLHKDMLFLGKQQPSFKKKVEEMAAKLF